MTREQEVSRIAILTSEFAPFLGGIGTYVREIATAATNLGHDVTVFAPSYGRTDLHSKDQKKFIFKVKRFTAGAQSLSQYPSYVRVCVSLRKARGEGAKYDQILAASAPFVDVMAATKRLHGRRYNIMLHGSEIKKEKSSLRGKLFSPLRVFESAEKIFTNSNYTRQLLLSEFPKVDKQRVVTTYLGVSPYWFEAPARKIDIRQQLKIDAKKIIVVSVARITARKGQMDLVQAVGKMPDELRRRLTVVFVGDSDGKENDYVEELHTLSDKETAAQIIFAGKLTDEEIKSLYDTSAIFCLPGAIHKHCVEGFGLVFLEAGSRKLPSIAGRLGGVPEAIDNCESGLLFELGDVDSLASLIVQAVIDPNLIRRLGGGALRKALQFSWERCARETFSK